MIQDEYRSNVKHQVNGKILFAFLVILGSVILSNNVYATHASGADLQYRWISGRTYEVTASFYRDCAGVAAPASISLNARSASCAENQDYTLNLVAGSGQEITFPCRAVQTICTNSGSAYSGYEQYLYKNNITLPQNCTDWIFSFYICCRNCAITTLNSPCSENLYVEGTLNNVIAPTNSSPKFTNIPVAFLCINQSFTYNHGVIDPDGDSLVYSFITPKTYNTSTFTVNNVTFNAGYSATQPLTSSPAVTINSFNGDITMFPTVNGEIGVTAILIKEYRNGVPIGSVIRDMQFLTRDCGTNFLPSASGINGTAVFDTSACPGSTISFTVNSSDPNAADTVTMTWNNGINGATFSTAGALLPQGTFTWTPTPADARSQPYSFTITVRDNSCPLRGSQTYSYSILVPLITASVTSPLFNGFNVACRGGGTGTATAQGNGGGLPYLYSWNPSGQSTQTAVNLISGIHTVTITEVHGCTASTSDTLTQPPAVVSISVSSTTNVSCNGGNDGTITIAGGGGIGPYSYSWNNGQTTPTATGLSFNTYTATVTDQNGCTSQQGITITQPPFLNASISSFQNVTCLGNSNGKINTSVSGGTSPYTHNWSNGDTTGNITGLPPGTYKDTVRDSKGCTQILSQTITQPGSAVSIPSSSVSTTNVSCFGLSDGNANVNPTGGTFPYTVTWSNGDIGNSADTLTSGNYTAHIVDGNGCTFDTIITITEPANLISSFTNYSIAPSGTNIRCNGDTTGRVKIVPAGGTFPYAYLWSNSVTIDSIKNVPAGIYSVRITDSKGCTFSDTTTLTEPTALNDSLRIRNVGCKGESSGGIRAITYNGSPLYTYAWSHGPFVTDTVGNLPAGFYQVTITDTNGCQKIDTVTINEPSILVPLILTSTYIGAVNVLCHGDTSGSATLNVFGGTRPFSYLWSQNGIDSFVTGLGAGFISVRVVDANGCSIIRDTILSEPQPFIYGPTVQNPLCYGDSSGYIVLNTSGSVGPYTYSWSNSGTTDSIGHLSSGFYYAIVQDANNCRDSVAFTLSNPDSLTANTVVSNYQGYNGRCNGDTSSYIALHVTGGSGSYTYQWSNSATVDSISSLSNGTYSVTILDGKGCRKDTSVTLTQPPILSPTISLSLFNGGANVSCNGYIDGVAHSSVAGGVPPYHYLWSNGDVTDSALGLGAGAHTLTVTDSNGCSVVLPFSLLEPTPVAITPTLSNFNGFNVGCFGDSSACITIGTSGGNAPYTYVWDARDTINNSMLCNLPADTFSVRIIDANGCQLDTFFILTTPQPLSDSTVISNFNGVQIQCNGMTNGSIDVSVLGGAGPFTYAWSNSGTSQDLSNLSAGIYQLIITDANSCKDTVAYTLNEPPVLSSAMAFVTNVSCNGLSDGTATVNPANGGTVPYFYNWSNGDSGLTADSLSTGVTNVTVADINNCMKVIPATIVEPAPIVVTTSAKEISCDGKNDGRAAAFVSGGIASYLYSWLPSGGNDSVAVNLPDGTYTVTITDMNNCTETAVAIVKLGDCDLDLPTAFSPNGDGYNDYYIVHGLSRYPKNIFKVFNRWGNEVFSTEDYKNNEWYGQNSTGENLPDGTYFVSFVVKNEDIHRNNFVDLRR